MKDWKADFIRFSRHYASLIAILLVLTPIAAKADNLGAIGAGAAVFLVLAVGLFLVIACIVLAVMLGRWIAKPSRVSGFSLIGLSLILSLCWFFLLGSVLVSELGQVGSLKDTMVMLAWVLLGGGLLSIAPVMVVIRSIRLLKVLWR